MGSSTASVQFNGGRDGLVGEIVEDQVSAASGMGNAEVSIKGEDSQGDSIKGNNEDFSLSVELEHLSSKISDAAKQLLEHFLSLASNGVIKLPTPTAETIQKVQSFFRPK